MTELADAPHPHGEGWEEWATRRLFSNSIDMIVAMMKLEMDDKVKKMADSTYGHPAGVAGSATAATAPRRAAAALMSASASASSPPTTTATAFLTTTTTSAAATTANAEASGAGSSAMGTSAVGAGAGGAAAAESSPQDVAGTDRDAADRDRAPPGGYVSIDVITSVLRSIGDDYVHVDAAVRVMEALNDATDKVDDLRREAEEARRQRDDAERRRRVAGGGRGGDDAQGAGAGDGGAGGTAVDAAAMLDTNTYWMKTDYWTGKPINNEQARAVIYGIQGIVNKCTNKATQETMKVMLAVFRQELATAVEESRAVKMELVSPVIDRCVVLYGAGQVPGGSGDSRVRGAAMAAGAARLSGTSGGIADRHKEALKVMAEAGAVVAQGPAKAFGTAIAGLGGGAGRFVLGGTVRGGGRGGARDGGPTFRRCYACGKAGHIARDCKGGTGGTGGDGEDG